jgi:hypothetical protein
MSIMACIRVCVCGKIMVNAEVEVNMFNAGVVMGR